MIILLLYLNWMIKVAPVVDVVQGCNQCYYMADNKWIIAPCGKYKEGELIVVNNDK